jgi:hypothetical protein
MNTQVNWKKIRNEFQRLTDVEQLKAEVHRIGSEIRKFDYHSVLSPSAQSKVKTFEKRYSNLMRTIGQAQRQVDREFNRILRQIKTYRSDVEGTMTQQKAKLQKVSHDLRKRFSKKAAAPVRSAGNPTTRKKARTTATKKKRK